MSSPDLLTLYSNRSLRLQLQPGIALEALGVGILDEMHLRCWQAEGADQIEAMADLLATSSYSGQLWSLGLYQQAPLEGLDIQPFQRLQKGRGCSFLMAGSLPEIHDAERFPIEEQWPLACSDQERAFCVLLERVRKLWSEGRPDHEMRLALVADFAGRLNRLGELSFIYWDGEYLFAYSALHESEFQLAYHTTRLNKGQAFNTQLPLQISVDDEPSAFLPDPALSVIGFNSQLDQLALPIPAGAVYCFHVGQLLEQCEPVQLWI